MVAEQRGDTNRKHDRNEKQEQNVELCRSSYAVRPKLDKVGQGCERNVETVHKSVPETGKIFFTNLLYNKIISAFRLMC